jgi:prolyl-tRNA synthetase
LDNIESYIQNLLDEIQENLFTRALKFRAENMHQVDTYEEFKTQIEEKGGFYLVHWDGTIETEAKIKAETQATFRCIPLDAPDEEGKCMVTGLPSKKRLVLAKAY